jgi:type II secretory pathway pseudopilin PulG
VNNVKYYESIITAFLTVFLILAFIAVARLSQIKNEAIKTREASEATQIEMAKTARAAARYQEWILNATNPAAVGIR